MRLWGGDNSKNLMEQKILKVVPPFLLCKMIEEVVMVMEDSNNGERQSPISCNKYYSFFESLQQHVRSSNFSSSSSIYNDNTSTTSNVTNDKKCYNNKSNNAFIIIQEKEYYYFDQENGTSTKTELYSKIQRFISKKMVEESCCIKKKFEELIDSECFSKKIHDCILNLNDNNNGNEDDYKILLLYEIALSILVNEIITSSTTNNEDNNKEDIISQSCCENTLLIEKFIQECCSGVTLIASAISSNIDAHFHNKILPLLLRCLNHVIRILSITDYYDSKNKTVIMKMYSNIFLAISPFLPPASYTFDTIQQLLHSNNNTLMKRCDLHFLLEQEYTSNTPSIFESRVLQYFKTEEEEQLKEDDDHCSNSRLLVDLSKSIVGSENTPWNCNTGITQRCADTLLWTLYNHLFPTDSSLETNPPTSTTTKIIPPILQMIGIDTVLTSLHDKFFHCEKITTTDKLQDKESRKSIFKEKHFFQFCSIIYTIFHLLPSLSISTSTNTTASKNNNKKEEEAPNKIIDISNILSILYTLLDDYKTNYQILGGILFIQLFQHINTQHHNNIHSLINQNQIDLCRHVLTTAFQRSMSIASIEDEKDYLYFIFYQCIHEFTDATMMIQKQHLCYKTDDNIVWIQDLLRYFFQQFQRQYYNNPSSHATLKIILFQGIHPLLNKLQQPKEEQYGTDIVSIALSSILYVLNEETIDATLIYGIGIIILDLLYISYPVITFHSGKMLCSLLLHCYRLKSNQNNKNEHLYDFIMYVASATYFVCGEKAECVLKEVKENRLMDKEEDGIAVFVEDGDLLIHICLDVEELAKKNFML